mgnify:CR=1 FL=1
MSTFKKTLLFLFFYFYISNSFGAMVTYVQDNTFLDGPHTTGGDENSGNDKQSRFLNGIHFNADGTKLFTSYNMKPQLDGTNDTFQYIHEYNLSKPYDISTRTYAGNDERCVLGSGSDGHTGNQAHDLEFSNDGMKLFTSDKTTDILFRFDLTSPYDVSTCSFVYETTTVDTAPLQNGSNGGNRNTGNNIADNRLQGFEINEDGTKLFLLFHDVGTAGIPRLLEYSLSTPFDLRTLSLTLNAGIKLTGHANNPNTMRFSNNGKRIFVVSHGGTFNVTQISLNSAYDTSSFTIDGSVSLTSISGASTLNQPRGTAFSSSGLKMYIGNDSTSSIFEFNLVCPFNLFKGKCPAITENNDRHGLALAQIDIAKRTIDHSVDTALNRLKWIRRNKDKQNLSNLNIDFNFTNKRLASLTELVKKTAIKKKTNNDKDQNVFYWSEGSISLGKIGDTGISSTRKIDTNAITFGSDRFTKNNGIRGLAFRFGKNDVDVGNAGSNLDTDTYNLTYYDTSAIKDDTKFLDKIFGIGKLSSDLLTVLDGNNLTAERDGLQMYGTFRIKDEIKKDNLTLIPYQRFDVGHTILGSYQESGPGAIDVQKQHVRSKKIRAGLSAIEDLSNDKYTFKRHGKLEYVADVDRSSNFKYKYVGDGSATINDKLHSEAFHNINGEIGVDIVLPDSFSIFLIYERNQAIDSGHTDKVHIAIGYLPNKETNYAFTIEGSENLLSKLELKKNINGFNLGFNINDDLTNLGDYREANIVLNKVF